MNKAPVLTPRGKEKKIPVIGSHLNALILLLAKNLGKGLAMQHVLRFDKFRLLKTNMGE